MARLLVSLALCVCALFVSTELLLREAVLPKDDFTAHVRIFRSAKTGDAAFGDSHVARNVVPDDDMVNLAFPSEGIEHIAWKVRRYFRKRQPGRIILQADPHLFAPYRLSNRLENYSDKFSDDAASFWRMAMLDSRLRPQLSAFWWSFIFSGGELTSQVTRTENGAMLSKGDLSRLSPRRLKVFARWRVNLHRPVMGRAAKELMAIYGALLDFLRARGARVCLVTFPLSAAYRQALDRLGDRDAIAFRDEILRFFHSEARRVRARYVDMQRAITDLSSFRDVDHLNDRAAPGFSQELMKSCFGNLEKGRSDRADGV